MTLRTPDVAIIGGSEEAEVRRIADCLRLLEHFPLIIDTFVFPWEHHLSFIDGAWWYNDYELRSIKAFFLRSLHCNPTTKNRYANAPDSAGMDIMKVLREKDSILGSLLRWAHAKQRLVLNPIHTLRCHFYKLDTLERLLSANIPIPATLGTNSLHAIRAFARSHKDLIYKPLAGGAEAVALSASDLFSEGFEQLRIAPVLLQERVYGDDIRVYVLEDDVVASASLSTDHPDFRTGPQNFRPATLSRQESADVIKAAKTLSLRFAGIDFKRTKAAQHRILDVNPAPMFAGFEQITGLDIATKVARYLVNKVDADVRMA